MTVFILRPPRRNSGTGYFIVTINPPVFILHLKLAKGKNTCKKMPVHEIFFCRESKLGYFMDRQEVFCWLHPIRFSDVRVGDVHTGQNDGDADGLRQGKGLAQHSDAGGDGYDGGNADE